MRYKLLNHLYGAFNRDPDAVAAFTLAHAGGITWSISSSRLTVKALSGAALADVSLASGTVGSVAAALSLAGVTVESINPDVLSLHACVLVDGSEAKSNGQTNTVMAHRSVLLAMVSAYAASVQDAADAIPAAIDQVYLHKAEADWLDYWGMFFGIYRMDGMQDADYLDLIITETIRPRSNAFAIERAIHDALPVHVFIEEPWRLIFSLSGSKLSGHHKIKDGVTIGRNLIQPTSARPIRWAPITPMINTNRPAGVSVLEPRVRANAYFEATFMSASWWSFGWNTTSDWSGSGSGAGISHSSLG